MSYYKACAFIIHTGIRETQRNVTFTLAFIPLHSLEALLCSLGGFPPTSGPPWLAPPLRIARSAAPSSTSVSHGMTYCPTSLSDILLLRSDADATSSYALPRSAVPSHARAQRHRRQTSTSPPPSLAFRSSTLTVRAGRRLQLQGHF